MTISADATAFGYRDFRFSWGDHICAIFENHAQQMEIMLPFFVHGLELGQRCVWIGPEVSCTALRSGLAGLGGDLPTLEASGQLLLLADVDYYLKEGLFQPKRTMELLRTLQRDGQAQGYPTMRITGDVSWLVQRVDAELWETWEAAINDAIAGQPVVAVCQYSRRQVSGAMLAAALETHPFVILGDVFHENPFYTPNPSAMVQLC